MSITISLKKVNKKADPKNPVWKGPEEDGITFSLLSRFLCCRERFRLLVVEGLKPADTFNHRLEFGSMWHVCEESLAANDKSLRGLYPWDECLKDYAQSLCKRYPTSQEQIDNWYGICKMMFPIYVKHWSEHPDVVDRTPLLQEQSFNIPYALPSGRTVKLRGKWDSVDLVGKGKAGIYLQENKTKSDINEGQIKRQISFDLQTMLYLVALQEWDDDNTRQGVFAGEAAGKGFWVGAGAKVAGVRYNVVKRPRHYQGKRESKAEFLERLKGIIEASPEEFFMRWKVELTPGDVSKFRRECLDPILEQLCDWWEWVRDHPLPFGPRIDGSVIHWRHPFGVYNVLDEGGSTDLDEYLASGSEVGLQRTDNLFPELT